MKSRKVHLIIEIESFSTLSKLRSPSRLNAMLVQHGEYYDAKIKKVYLPKTREKAIEQLLP